MRSHGVDDRPQAHRRDFNRRLCARAHHALGIDWPGRVAHHTPMTERRRPFIRRAMSANYLLTRAAGRQ